MTEAVRKRTAALAAAGPFATSDPPTSAGCSAVEAGPSRSTSPYTVVLTEDTARVLFQNIEAPRVAAEERCAELGYEPAPYPWHERPRLGLPAPRLDELRLHLGPEELERYRAAGAAVAARFVETLGVLRPELRELEATAELAGRLHAAGFTTPVLLAGSERRAPVHRHPLPTDEPIGRFVLLAVTAEREGLHVSMTRIASFGRPPAELAERVRAAAEVDGAVLAAARAGRTLGELFEVLERAYAEQGFPGECGTGHRPLTRTTPSDRRGRRGRGRGSRFALGHPAAPTRTPSLGELDTAAGIPRPAIVEL